MRILSRSIRHGTAWCPSVAAMLAAAVMLAGNARAVDEIVLTAATTAPTEIVATPAAIAAPAATAEAEAKGREADAVARRHALLLLILNASGHPFGFFK
jgi:hypothetical protein